MSEKKFEVIIRATFSWPNNIYEAENKEEAKGKAWRDFYKLLKKTEVIELEYLNEYIVKEIEPIKDKQ